MSLRSSSFGANPPTFTLIGATSGGPPTSYNWRRNYGFLWNSSTYSISIEVNPGQLQEGRVNCYYQSTIVVTGMLPGIYDYQVSNRAASHTMKGSITIEGK